MAEHLTRTETSASEFTGEGRFGGGSRFPLDNVESETLLDEAKRVIRVEKGRQAWGPHHTHGCSAHLARACAIACACRFAEQSKRLGRAGRARWRRASNKPNSALPPHRCRRGPHLCRRSCPEQASALLNLQVEGAKPQLVWLVSHLHPLFWVDPHLPVETMASPRRGSEGACRECPGGGAALAMAT